MPWDCKTCNTYVEEDNVSVCPQCGEEKLAWTMAADKTRTFTVKTKAARYLFGSGRAPVDASEKHYPNEESWEPAERVIAVPKSTALQWKEDGKLPPPEQILLAWVDRTLPVKSPVTFGVTTEYAAQRPAETHFVTGKYDVEWERIQKPKGYGYVYKPETPFAFLFVFGPEELPDDFSFPGVDVVDITEEGTELGYAPQIDMKLWDAKKVVFIVDRLERGWAERLECRQLVFNHDSHLALPEGLAVLLLVLRRSHETQRPLVLCGHTDASGTSEYNEGLAADRCTNVLALLEGDRTAWAESSYANYRRLSSEQRKPDAKYLKAWLEKIPSSYNSLTAWEGIFDEYEEALKGELAGDEDGPDLATLRAGVVWVDADRKVVSCAEEYLKVNPKSYMSPEDLAILESWETATKTQQTNVNQMLKVETNRRIEFLWFEADRLPWQAADAPENAAARQAVYGPGGWQTWDYQSADGPFTFDQIACPPALSIKPPPGNLLFVIDLSFSMTFPFDPPNRTQRIAVLKEQLDACLTALTPPTRKFGILRFGSRADERYDFWRLAGPDGQALPPKTLHLANDANIQAARNWVGAQVPYTTMDLRFTNTYGALELALDVDEVEAIVFLSDGMPTVGTDAAGEGATLNELKILEKVRTWNTGSKIQIDTYGFQPVTPATSVEDEDGKTVSEKVAALYEAELIRRPVIEDKPAKDAAFAAAATKANEKEVGGKTDWTGRTVEGEVLGWFLERLAKKCRNGGRFVNLNLMVSVD